MFAGAVLPENGRGQNGRSAVGTICQPCHRTSVVAKRAHTPDIPSETQASKSVSAFRPIATVRLLYKLFAYLMLGRMEDAIEASQPDEQHGFRRGRRIEEHFLTADVWLQKLWLQKHRFWIIDLDLAEMVHSIWRSKFSRMLYLLGRKVNEHALCQEDGTFPLGNTSFITSSKALKKISWRMFQKFSHKS